MNAKSHADSHDMSMDVQSLLTYNPLGSPADRELRYISMDIVDALRALAIHDIMQTTTSYVIS